MNELPQPPTDHDKQALIDELIAARNDFLQIVRDLPADLRQVPLSAEGWTARDLLGHVASWEDRLLTLAQMLINREEHKVVWMTTPAEVDAWNHKEYLRKRDWSWQEAIRDLALIREELLWNLGWATPEALFERHEASGAAAAAADMMAEVIDHDRVHAAQLVGWLAGQNAP